MFATFIRTLYNLALLLLLILGSPWWLLRYATSARFRAGLGQRFFGPSVSFGNARPSGPRIWIHAVSVGEVLAISGLVRELATRAEQYAVVVSTTTRTGQALAQERFGAGKCFYFPLDFPWSVNAVLRHLHPSMLVLAESELWPNVLTACKRSNIPVLLVNARVSDRSLPRYQRLHLLWHPFLQMLTVVQTQTTEDAIRFKQIGVPGDRIKVGGNLKYDVRAPQNSPLVQQLRDSLAHPTELLVCASTLEGEEALLLSAWPDILKTEPNAVMLLAPRHPERFDRVASLLAASTHPWLRRSQWIARPQAIAAGSIFLLDSIGELASLFSLAHIAFIGGSLVPAGGHNPLEPAQFGIPITMGPHYENFRAIVELLQAQQAIQLLDPSAIAAPISALFQHREAAAELGRNAKRVFEEQSGAAARAADAILTLLAKSGAA